MYLIPLRRGQPLYKGYLSLIERLHCNITCLVVLSVSIIMSWVICHNSYVQNTAYLTGNDCEVLTGRIHTCTHMHTHAHTCTHMKERAHSSVDC